MKKICVLLDIAFKFSISVMNATSEVSSFDDCDHALLPPEPGLRAPTNTPQAGPASNEAGIPSDSFAALLFLPVTTKLFEAEAENPRDDAAEKDEKQDSVHEADVAAGEVKSLETSNKSNNLQTPELQLYGYEQDGDGFILKRHTPESLKADYYSLLPGQTYVVTLKPSFNLAIDGVVMSPLVFPSSWDTIPVFAKIRAWAKWWLNPYAWWDSSYYSLSYHESKIDWDDKTHSQILTTNLKKDTKYLLSQLAFYLYSPWGSKYMNPYIVPETRWVFDGVMKLRFYKVEKVVLESVGFKNVRIETRVNPISNYLEYCILAEK